MATFPYEKIFSQLIDLIQKWGFARMITMLGLRLRSLAKSDIDKNKTHKSKDRRYDHSIEMPSKGLENKEIKSSNIQVHNLDSKERYRR